MTAPDQSWLAIAQTLRVIAEGLSYQAECRPRPSRSRECLKNAVADIYDAIAHITVEDQTAEGDD